MHADRTNRAVLILAALVLMAGGAGVVVLSTGLFATGATGRAISDNVVSGAYVEHGAWLWPVTAAVALVVLLLAVRWLIAILFSTDRVSDHRVPGDGSDGTTTLAAGALAAALGAEIEGYEGVQSTGVRLIGDASAPRLVLDVTLAADADPDAVRNRIETDAVAHARTAMDQPELPAVIDLSVGRRSSDRVH